ncbi:MAG: PEPxxWA-CTERM sorting domain-containing protein [Pseudomonadota bacterium]
MRRLGYVVASSLVLAAPSAQAADIFMDISGVNSGSISQGGGTMPWDNGMLANMVKLPNSQTKVGYGGSNETIVDVTSSYASFESGVAVSGSQASAVSNSGLDILIQNTGGSDVQVNSLESTILPAGLGFYIQDRTGNAADSNIFTGYGQNTAYTFESFANASNKGTTFATAGFTFEVWGDDYLFGEGQVNDEAQPLYSLYGELTLGFDLDGHLVRGGNIQAAGLSLGNFATAYDTNYALAYAWGFKDIEVIINALLGAGDSMNLYYRTTAYAQTDLACLNATTCLVGYSGFGDPVGRGGGASNLVASRGFMTAQALNPITGIDFTPQQMARPTINITDLGGGTGAVPEPATWMTMILGFASLGAALRRRRALAYS